MFIVKVAYIEWLRRGALGALLHRAPVPPLLGPTAHINGAVVEVKSSGGLDQ
jgi:hypothetical protein